MAIVFILIDINPVPLLVPLHSNHLDYELIRDKFGDEVAEIVWRVTDEPGRNRKERKAATYLKIRQNERAIALKIC